MPTLAERDLHRELRSGCMIAPDSSQAIRSIGTTNWGPLLHRLVFDCF